MIGGSRALYVVAPLALGACSLTIDTSGFSSGQAPVDASAAPPDGATVGDAGDGGGDAAVAGASLLAAGGLQTCAARGSSAWCWGSNARGQLGEGTKDARAVPTPVVGLPAGTVDDLSVGELHACAVVAGAVWCWGAGTDGELGDGRKADSLVPVKVSGLAEGKATHVCAGTRFSCAVADTMASCWGINAVGQVGMGTTSAPVPTAAAVTTGNTPLTGVDRIACGQDHACARKASGDVFCWGHNDYGAIAAPTSVDHSPKALAVAGLPAAAELVSIGGWHACATAAGGVWCWGTATGGELGNGGLSNSSTPVPAFGLGSGVTSLAVAGAYAEGDATCAVKDGDLWCWGNGQYGRLGDGLGAARPTPAKVSGAPGATRVAGGFLHFCATFADGELRCWGRGSSGQLGDGAGVDRLAPVAAALPRAAP